MVTSQKEQIQSLIADIEKALGKERPRTPWVKTSETEQQREALARAQAYLMSLQQSFDAPGGWGPVDPSTGQIATQPAAPASPPAADTSAENVLQALLTEMKFLKSSALEPLRLEMDSLRQERDRLNEEVKALAEQRSQALLENSQLENSRIELANQVNQSQRPASEIDEEQLNQFLQTLMTRLQEKLSLQVSNTLGYLESEHSAAMNKLTAATELEILELKPTDQIEEIRQIQSRSDQLLANIDSTLQQMFETLQTNIDSYQLSLNEGIENMHSLGRQGEVIVRSLVDHLTQQLGQATPPEPVFYPGPPDALADAGVQDTSDTVSSLSEILPGTASANDTPANDTSEQTWPTGSNAAAIEALQSSVGQSSVDSSVVDQSSIEQISAEQISTEPSSADAESAPNAKSTSAVAPATDSEEEEDPEAFIREDGTIDLDLLKLDIDRSEDDPTLTRDDLMIDAGVADEQVAATLSVDTSDIESKVVPTANAAFLADLTFDDLVTDTDTAAVSIPEVNVPELNVPEDPFLQASAEGSSSEHSSEEVTAADTVEADTEDDIPDPALAAVLPNFGTSPASIDQLTAAQTTTDQTAQADNRDDDVSSDIGPNESPNETGNEPYETDDETYTEAGDETIREASDETADKPESAMVPDSPDTESDVDTAVPADDVDAILSDDLLAVLEDANAEAERIAIEAVDADLDELIPDLEESALFEEDLPTDTTLDASDEPLESAAIPDQPEENEQADYPDSEISTQIQQAVTQMPPEREPQETPAAPTADAPETNEQTPNTPTAAETAAETEPATSPPSSDFANLITPNLPPIDFDDDLDFFQTEPPTPETSPAASSAPEKALTDTTALVEPPTSPPTATAEYSAEPEAAQTPAAEEPIETRFPDDDEGEDDPTGGEPADWFLGIDLGATGLSAVVINQRGEQVYPLCWNISGDSEANRFRLPTVANVNPQAEGGNRMGQIGPVALQQPAPLLRNLKLMVKAGIPDSTENTPWMQWADHVAMPLTSLQNAIVTLLQTLHPDHMSCRAVGLKQRALHRILSDLKGVVVGYPTNWPDTYGFNLRECVLAAGLVSSPDRVFFVEEAIAALLSALPAPEAADSIDAGQQPGLYNCNWSGGTVVISAGAILTETAVANLPDELSQLSYQNFLMRGYTYAGDGIDQDIICQLLHQPLKAEDSSVDSNGEDRWAQLALDNLPLPQPGEADRVNRHRLRQRLNDSPLGREAVMAARELKVALQEEDEVEVELGNHTWIVTRKDLETKVFLPYIQRINRQVNALLSKQNLPTQGVKQVVCTGGSASLSVIARWLRQKFPNATIIQDTYTGEYSNSCSRVAYGLANLCHYPNVLDTNRHKYNDYFLLLELLRILPEQPLPAGGILHMLEQRGINTQTCQAHVLALIEGHLPPGLVPTSGDRPLISAQSSDIATYKALSELPLFRKQGGQIYIADPKQGERLRSHLDKLLATKAQSLSAPMSPAALTEASVQV